MAQVDSSTRKYVAGAQRDHRRHIVSDKTSIINDETALVRRVEHTEAWKYYAPKGLALWQKFLDRDVNQPDQDPCDLENNYAIPANQVKKDVRPISNTRTFLERLGVPTGPDYFKIFSYWPRGEQQDSVGEFSNTYSPKEGVMIASSNARHTEEGNPDPKTVSPITPEHWSDIAWGQWKRACVTVNPGITAFTTDFSNVKLIMRNFITNEATLHIIGEAAEGKVKGDVIYFYPTDPGDKTSENAFWPLLGSPNGNGIINMLKDHKSALHSKSITRLGVLIDVTQDDEVRMWAELTGANINQDDFPLPP